MVKRDSLLDLRELGLDPGIVNIAVCVEPRKRLEALLLVAVVDEPSRALRENENQGDEDDGGDDLDPKRNFKRFRM